MEHAGTLRARDYLASFAQGDTEAMKEFFADDVVWHVGGRHRLSGDYRGREALFAYFDEVRELTAGSLTVEEEHVLSSDQHTAMFTRVRGSLDGRSLDVSMAQTFKVGPDGRWTEYFAMADDQKAVDAFWGAS